MKLFRTLIPWLKSSAIQQGIIFCCVSVISIFILASATIFYVDYELDKQNEEIVKESIRLITDHNEGTLISHEVDDDPIEDDDVIDILKTGFVLSGFLVSLLTIAVVAYFSRQSQSRINKIEQVLNLAAEGNLGARTGEKHVYDDLSQISFALDDMLFRLEASVNSMRDISANIAHELKTPITRLRHNLLMFKDKADSEFENHGLLNDLELALEESSRIAATFDALLRISQIESGARRSRFSELDLVQLVENVGDIYVDVAEDAKMKLTLELPSAPVMVEGDKELLVQLLANLIENAIRYCPENSQISLSCGLNNDQAWLRIEDNGFGIDESEKSRVFERLYRVDKSRTDGGLGLGLSLVKAVTGLHYGDVTLYDCFPGLGINVQIPSKKIGG